MSNSATAHFWDAYLEATSSGTDCASGKKGLDRAAWESIAHLRSARLRCKRSLRPGNIPYDAFADSEKQSNMTIPFSIPSYSACASQGGMVGRRLPGWQCRARFPVPCTYLSSWSLKTRIEPARKDESMWPSICTLEIAQTFAPQVSGQASRLRSRQRDRGQTTKSQPADPGHVQTTVQIERLAGGDGWPPHKCWTSRFTCGRRQGLHICLLLRAWPQSILATLLRGRKSWATV